MYISKCREFLFLIALAALSSCSSYTKIPLPEVRGALIAGKEREAFVSALRGRESKLFGYKSLFRTRIRSGDDGTVSLRHAVVARKPGSVRIETLPLQGAYSLSILVSLEGKVAVYDAESNTIEREDLGRKMIKRVLGVNAEERDLIAILSGSLPPSQFGMLTEDDIEIFFNAGQAEFEIKRGNYDAFARVDSKNFSLKYFEARSAFSGDSTIQVQYDGLIPSQNFYFPRKISIVLPQEELTIQMTRSALKVDEDIPDSLFVLQG